jgi:hypothetical protein
LGSIAIVALFTFIGGDVVRLLWNWLLPPLFGWRQVCQALGLLALCRIVFGGLGFHGRSRSNSRIRDRLADRMADRVAERWAHMTPEERERCRQRVRERCGFDPGTRESQAQGPGLE